MEEEEEEEVGDPWRKMMKIMALTVRTMLYSMHHSVICLYNFQRRKEKLRDLKKN